MSPFLGLGKTEAAVKIELPWLTEHLKNSMTSLSPTAEHTHAKLLSGQVDGQVRGQIESQAQTTPPSGLKRLGKLLRLFAHPRPDWRNHRHASAHLAMSRVSYTEQKEPAVSSDSV